MELALPLLALGGLYVASNRENNYQDSVEPYRSNLSSTNAVEGYQSKPSTRGPRAANTQPSFPQDPSKFNQKGSELGESHRTDNPNAFTDRYFNASGQNIQDEIQSKGGYSSLTGNDETTPMTHNNMVPFFSSKSNGPEAEHSASILDNMGGSGSQYISKKEQAPLFAPQKNIRFANGTPNQTDFMQSRVVPSQRMANVKTWDEQRVGPGLDQGYTVNGDMGFNSGMAARDKWVDRNVDQLRVETNPKLTFSLDQHKGPATYFNNAPATIETQGKVEKYMPDTYYVNTPDRWLTTTGLEKGQTSRSEQMNKEVNRTSTTSEYYGVDSNPDGTKMYTERNYKPSTRPQLDPNPIMNPTATGSGDAGSTDYGKKSYNSLPNNRSTCSQPQVLGGVHGMLKSVVAPLLDVLRPSRKENVIGNCRPNGNVQTAVAAPPVYNPADRAPTTIRETTEGKLDNNHLNVERQTNAAYLVNKQQAINNQRDTTTDYEYYGDSGGAGAHTGCALYDASYRQRNNVNKSYESRPNQGGMGLLNATENVEIHRSDNDRDNNRMWVPNAGRNLALPSVETHGKLNSVPQSYLKDDNSNRLTPDLLSAFKENPYTQSLSSY